MTQSEALKKIEDAGVVGCGGAGFPTHKKLSAKAELLVLNGAECEPLLQTDKYIMRHFAKELVSAAEQIGKIVGAKRIVFGLKEHYTEELAALSREIKSAESSCELFELQNFYPAGDEQVLIHEITGKTVPPAGIPLAVGAVVVNVGTALNVSRALDGEKVGRKLLTVSGALRNPCIVDAPLGASMERCLKAAGETIDDSAEYLLGGPMMGRYLTGLELRGEKVEKTSSGIIKLPESYMRASVDITRMLKRAKSACIQCRSCTDLCPRNLMGHPIEPHKIMRRLSAVQSLEDALELPEIENALLCCECGCCESFACPMGLAPRTINASLKAELRRRGIKYESDVRELSENPFKDGRKISPRALVARLGLSEYLDIKIDKCIVI